MSRIREFLHLSRGWFLAIAVALSASTLSAAPILHIEPVFLAPHNLPTSRTLNVFLTNPDPAPLEVSAFQWTINVDGVVPGYEFSAASATAGPASLGVPPEPYIFEGNSFVDSFPPFTFDVPPNNDTINAVDIHSGIFPNDFRAVQPGERVSLGTFTVDVPPFQDEMEWSSSPISFDPDFTDLTLSDGSLLGNFFGADGPLTLQNGFVNVVPEPSSLALFALAATSGACWWFRRRRAA